MMQLQILKEEDTAADVPELFLFLSLDKPVDFSSVDIVLADKPSQKDVILE